MKNNIKNIFCPYCQKEHEVEIRGFLAIQLSDNTRICVYRCPITNKEFKIRK